MQVASISRIVGLLLMLLSLNLIPPIFVEWCYQDGQLLPFHLSLAATFGLGFLLWFFVRSQKIPLRTPDGFLIVFLFWLVACVMASLPFYWSSALSLSFTDSFFEAMSGLTTTGSTILPQLEHLPHSILYYRQQLQFLGGIGIILLAVAIIPALGIGGMQLFRTEITGPVKDDKLTPRITQTAKAIWSIYLAMTFLCAAAYWFSGMSLFDAISHSFSTVSTGGFSTHDDSLAYFNNRHINLVALFFMLLGAVSFNLHFLMIRRKKISVYLQDPEFRFYIRLVVSTGIICWITLAILGKHHGINTVDTLFEVGSFLSTTGFMATNYILPSFIPMMLLLGGLIGGCAGSTAGGLKIIRVLLLQKQGMREIKRLIHPHGQYIIKLGDTPISARVIEAIWGYFAIYFVVFLFLLLLLLVVEEDFFSIFTALIATLSNTGRGLGMVAHNFSELSDYAKWILSFAMLAGRLEILTILVLLTPTFWRR